MKGRVWQDPRCGDYVVILELGKHPDGRRNAPWVGRFEKRTEAETHLIQCLHELQENTYVESSVITVAEWCERWLRDYIPLAVAETTLEQYRKMVHHHIVSELGPIKLQKLDKPTIQRAITAWSKTLAPSTTRQVTSICKAMLKEAVASGIIKRNPAQSVVLPRVERREMRALDEQQTVALLDQLVGNKLYLPALIAVSTGMRRGEILGLKWTAIQDGVATVTEAISCNGQVRPPKSELGRRRIVLPPSVVVALEDRRAAQEVERQLAGNIWKDTGYVFTRADGSPWSANDISCNWTRTMKRLGIKLRFHDLRHTHATQLLSAGMHVKAVAARLGHDPGETLRTYAHVLPGMDEQAAEIAEGIIASRNTT